MRKTALVLVILAMILALFAIRQCNKPAPEAPEVPGVVEEGAPAVPHEGKR